MRPTELLLKDFRSFKGEHRVSFADRRLVAIAGPIGSGKTSILDAIAYALYGQTPKLGRQSAQLINQEAGEMTVRLRFFVGEAGWEVERLARRRGAGSAALYPYSEPDGRNPLEVVSGARNVNPRIEEILGMDFAAFSRSILLPQGQFAEFLQATASEKDKVLKGVFGLERIDRMRQVARDRALAARHRAENAAEALAGAERARAALADLEPELEEASGRAKAVGSLQTQVGQIAAAEQALTVELDRIRSASAALAGAAGRLRPAAEIAQLVAAAEAAASRIRAAEQALAERREAMEAAEAGFDQFRAEHGGDEGIRAATDAVEVLRAGRRTLRQADAALRRADAELAAATSQAAELDSELAAASAAAARRTRDLERAQQERSAAQQQVADLERADMARTLRARLASGEQCPVCGQAVADLPEGHAHPDLEAARVLAGKAAKTQERAAAALARARDGALKLGVRLEAAAVRVRAAETGQVAAAAELSAGEAEIAGARLKATERLNAADPEAALAELELELERRRGRRAACAREFANTVEREQQVRADGLSAQQQVSGLQAELSGIAGQLDALELADSLPDRDVATLSVRLREFAAERARGLAAEREQARQAAAELAGQRRRLLAEWDLPADTDVNRFAAGVHAGAAALGARAQELGKQAARAPELARQKSVTERRRRHLERLTEDLRDSRFLKFMLAGKRIQLAELGGLRIRELTGDRFGFSPGDRFEVIDYGAADPGRSVRSSDTLSGGETFLASLSLALALADLVAGQGGRLGSFFLDEGFGSLDTDHLVVAMDGIERLAAETDDRLVAVVSHVPGVRERVEDQIILETYADPGVGSRIRFGADPA